MAGGRLPQAVVDQRREAVKDLWLQGKSTRAITDDLFGQGIANPTTGEKYDHSTIAHDLKKIREEFVELRAADIGKARAESFAKLERLEKEAWVNYEALKASQFASQALNVVKGVLADQRSIYGLDAPKATKHVGENEGPIEIVVRHTKRAAKL